MGMFIHGSESDNNRQEDEDTGFISKKFARISTENNKEDIGFVAKKFARISAKRGVEEKRLNFLVTNCEDSCYGCEDNTCCYHPDYKKSK